MIAGGDGQRSCDNDCHQSGVPHALAANQIAISAHHFRECRSRFRRVEERFSDPVTFMSREPDQLMLFNRLEGPSNERLLLGGEFHLDKFAAGFLASGFVGYGSGH